MTSDTSSVYNSTDGPLLMDRAGRVLPGRERSDGPVDVSASPVSGHIDAGRLVVVDEQPSDEQPSKGAARRSNPTQEA